jgi:spore maturation protein CgeB
MIDETILLLVYYYDQELYNYRLLKYIKDGLGVYLPFDLYLYKPLSRIFSKVILYDYLKQMAEIGVKAVNQEITELVRKERPKYVLWTSWRYDIQGSTFESIKKEGSIVVGWFFDDEWRFDDYSKWWIPYLDYCVTNAIEAVPKYRALGARVIQTIPNTGVALDCDWSKAQEKYVVSFVGSLRADREQYIKALKDGNIPIALFGEGWGGYVSFEEMVDIFKSTKINLNFSKDWRFLKPQIKGRIFQVCMAGGFLLTEYVPGIEEYFEIDKEIVCFRNKDEMMDKIAYYLNHDEERQTIARAGWERATTQYTSFHMVSRVFSEIGEDLAARGRPNNPHFPQTKIPRRVRTSVSQYHVQWGRALLEENYKGLWKDELALAIWWAPFSIRARYYYVISLCPRFIRLAVMKADSAVNALYRALLVRLGYIPYLKKIKQKLTEILLGA